MALNDQLDENAADLRNTQEAIQPTPPENQPPIAAPSSAKRGVSKFEVILAVGILIGALTILYLFLQKTPDSQSTQNGSYQMSPPIKLKSGLTVPPL